MRPILNLLLACSEAHLVIRVTLSGCLQVCSVPRIVRLPYNPSKDMLCFCTIGNIDDAAAGRQLGSDNERALKQDPDYSWGSVGPYLPTFEAVAMVPEVAFQVYKA